MIGDFQKGRMGEAERTHRKPAKGMGMMGSLRLTHPTQTDFVLERG